MTSDGAQGLRLPAEWEPQQAVMMAWPHAGTDWAYMLAQVQTCCVAMIRAIMPYAPVLLVVDPSCPLPDICDEPRCIALRAPTNDTWMRDFGMICTAGSDGVLTANDFKFNGWGLKFAADRDNLVTRRILRQPFGVSGADGVSLDGLRYANRLGFVLEGGSIESDGRGTLLTTAECLLSPNRNGDLSRAEIEDRLKAWLGADRVLWLTHGALEGDDTDSHIDTLARLAPDGVILYSSCDRQDDSHFAVLQAMEDELRAFTRADGEPYRLFPLPIPSPIYDEDGLRLPATYANFLIVNGAVIVPVYGDDHYDALALDTVAKAMPGYRVVAVDCRALICQHGSLHCMTMQIPCSNY